MCPDLHFSGLGHYKVKGGKTRVWILLLLIFPKININRVTMPVYQGKFYCPSKMKSWTDLEMYQKQVWLSHVQRVWQGNSQGGAVETQQAVRIHLEIGRLAFPIYSLQHSGETRFSPRFRYWPINVPKWALTVGHCTFCYLDSFRLNLDSS